MKTSFNNFKQYLQQRPLPPKLDALYPFHGAVRYFISEPKFFKLGSLEVRMIVQPNKKDGTFEPDLDAEVSVFYVSGWPDHERIDPNKDYEWTVFETVQII